MRSGLYAVVDGVEYPAWLNSEGLGIYLDHAGPRLTAGHGSPSTAPTDGSRLPR